MQARQGPNKVADVSDQVNSLLDPSTPVSDEDLSIAPAETVEKVFNEAIQHIQKFVVPEDDKETKNTDRQREMLQQAIRFKRDTPSLFVCSGKTPVVAVDTWDKEESEHAIFSLLLITNKPATAKKAKKLLLDKLDALKNSVLADKTLPSHLAMKIAAETKEFTDALASNNSLEVKREAIRKFQQLTFPISKRRYWLGVILGALLGAALGFVLAGVIGLLGGLKVGAKLGAIAAASAAGGFTLFGGTGYGGGVVAVSRKNLQNEIATMAAGLVDPLPRPEASPRMK